MKKIIISVLLSLLGPGLGQIYNGEKKKGVWLLIVAIALFLLPSFWLVVKIVPLLPDSDQEIITPQMVQTAAEGIIKENSHLLNILTFVFLGVWAYAITQAYFKAKELSEKENEQ